MGMLLGIDTGGTYTDAVLLDEERGILATAKALTTKDNLVTGIRHAVRQVLPNPSSSIALVSLSTTLATNAIVEGQGSPVCLLLLGYEPSSLEGTGLARLVGRESIVFIRGGHTPTGAEQAPLDVAAARQTIRAHASKVAAFAISGYFAVRNPVHELRVAKLVRRLTALPVTCGHELSDQLDAPRRAMTVALNARLIPLLRELILAVRGMLVEVGIKAPLMMVKGDGSLIDSGMALQRPLETILSGPAASAVGARYLTSMDDAIVVDMGGTTTDIATFAGGRPILNQKGARVGDWQTMVEGIDVQTTGLGGDSEVHLDGKGRLALGPRRVIPLSLLAEDYPAILQVLQRQNDEANPASLNGDAGRLVMRQRPLPYDPSALSATEQEIWAAMSQGPISISQLLSSAKYPAVYRRCLDQLLARGLAVVSAFTPTDASRILGRYEYGSFEAAKLGASLWARRLGSSEERVSEGVVNQVVVQLGRAVISKSIAEDTGVDPDAIGGAGTVFLDRAVGADDAGQFAVTVRMRRPIVAVGAPAATYFPPLAARLQASLCIPRFAEVANAVGAVAMGVVQTVRILIRPINWGEAYQAFLPSGPRQFSSLEAAVACAEKVGRRLARDSARRAGARAVELRVERDDRKVRSGGGYQDTFLETELTITAVGRPGLVSLEKPEQPANGRPNIGAQS